ncbi:alpha/beta-hydrolase [Zopfia rhizophila CBS 207.26]|uniref:Alpha/beta-hydrolase n=1 Tax=Zopfia rhizophila CBS 207.26 TaxID=1314779 RepID=A0A6A6E468_9PEZI|nr:alpha/beta-hydrolase [Zopfia rhizophila CBS 207.26]
MSSEETAAEKFLLQLKQKFLKEKAGFYYLPISVQQAKTAVEFPARGPAQVSRDIILAPSDDTLVKTVMSVIHELGDSTEQIPTPTLENVKIQWSSFRSGVSPNEPEPSIDEREKYRRMSSHTAKEPIIFYAHGGFYCTGSPATSRTLTTALAKSTNGRCFVLDHRLCPQNPFPAALVDAFLAYLSLLYPRPDNHHDPVQAKDVVFAGESAGGNLLLSLLLTIKHIHEKYGGRIKFFDEEVEVPFPSGFACVGCHMDMTVSFEFTDLNLKYDFLLPEPPAMSDKMQKCAVWPSDPPRGDMSCEISALCHPLISPIASRNWRLLPPMFLAYGEEYLGREGKHVAQRAVQDGVVVEFHHYQRLSHCFHLMYPNLLQSQHVIKEMARFFQTCVSKPEVLKCKNLMYPADLSEVVGRDIGLPFVDPEDLPFNKILERMRMRQSKREVWKGPGVKPSSSLL